jgi:hypothetical protein
VPVVRELEVIHEGEEALDGLVLELTADPDFLEPRRWLIDRLGRGSSLHIRDRDVKLQARFLADVTESVTGEVRLRLLQEETEIASTVVPMEILAKNQWGGCGSMPELLPAFCMPNDPAVDRILKRASDVLRRAGRPAGIDGYESKSRTRTWELVSALWSAVAGFEISYALPSAGFEQSGQRIRTPGAILDGRVATCLDTALLFASALEQARLNPLLILTEGHAFVGVWLQPQEFAQLITDEAAAVRKRVELQELVVFETTLVTQSPVPNFSAAVEAGKRQLTDERFQMALDIRRARTQRIRPLALGGAEMAKDTATPPAPAVGERLEEAPSLPGFDVEIEPGEVGPADRAEIWQRKLLDLTTRNRLLHLPERSKCVPLLCPEPAILEDRLAEGKRIRIVLVPELEAGGRDAALYNQQNQQDLYEQVAREVLDKGEVLSPLSKEKLATELIDLYRKARTDMDEGGANTLFLAIGFLKWKKSADDPRTYRAPLILIPVQLERRSALSGVTMVAHEDEPRFNLTLLELLRQDFELTIPRLDHDLPMDESGVNVPLVLEIVRHAVKEMSGFEVVPEIVIGTFSFAKYLMWKDLVDRRDQLVRSPVVRHLISREGISFESESEFPRPEQLDVTVGPEDLFIPLPADSSQIAAIVASAKGCNFVLDGPPGTGKSQTIANMIAHNLSLGRRVLFVAEKMAALDVVKRRLDQNGLGEFCLELHSNKTSKVEVLKQLERAWDTRDALTDKEWRREARAVRRLRDRLNAIVTLLHQTHPNGWTLHQAIGRVVRDGGDVIVRLSWAAGTLHDEAAYAKMRDVARRLDLNLGAIEAVPEGLKFIATTEWSNGWQESLISAAAEIPNKIDALLEACSALKEISSLPLPAPPDLRAAESLVAFGAALVRTNGIHLAFAFDADFREKSEAAQCGIALLTEYREIETSGLSARYPDEACTKIDLDHFDRAWEGAKKKFWILANLARWSLRRSLAKEAGIAGPVDPDRDLPQLRRLRQIAEEIVTLTPLLSGIPGWAGIQARIETMAAALDCAATLRAAISTQAASASELPALRSAVRNLVVDENDLLANDGRIAAAVARLSQACAGFAAAAERFKQLCDLAPETQIDFTALRDAALSIQGQPRQIKSWCDWCRTRAEAIQLGLASLVEAIETGKLAQGRVADAFEVGYARWFAADRIDAEPTLRGFVSAEHMSDIQNYRRLVDRLSALSTRSIRARLSGQLPSKNEVRKKDGYGILQHELQKQRRHKPVRQLAIEMGDALTRLAPCMLMSPLSIAQYLPPEMELFDLVIFDEASQIAPWDAIGSIARGKQVVIAGDPRQMPPTSFFNRSAAATDDDVEEDMESILDECLAAGVPRHSLDWHYRSRHESLIAFSNCYYYENKLVTFPAPVTRDDALVWRRVNGVYAKGKTRTNQAEAEAMVAEAVRRMKDLDFVQAGLTLGIVTLNAEQQKLVEDLFDKARQEHPEIEPFFDHDLPEPVVVKNLETVQGDERDLIMLGIGYGPTEPEAQTMSMNFGPLNRDGGWRRLNVALTRARREMILFTSFDPSMIDLNRTSARAVADLKTFLEFAHRGRRGLAEAVQGSLGGYKSPFEEAVARNLMDLGWEVVPQVGTSRFRIDLGIVHPDQPGNFLAGVECDGATYHRAATARDRDKVRTAVLGGLGWHLLRAWSTDWWVDPAGSTQRLHADLEQWLERSRAEEKTPEPPLSADSSGVSATHDCAPPETQPVREPSSPPIATKPVAGTYRITKFSAFADRIDPGKFYDDSYDETLAALVAHVLQSESPILDNLLVQRIARAHGFQRSGNRINDRILEAAERNHCLTADPTGGTFVWLDATSSQNWNQYRIPDSENDLRRIEEIAAEEIRAAASACPSGDTAIEVAKCFGIRRLTEQARKRIQATTRFL